MGTGNVDFAGAGLEIPLGGISAGILAGMLIVSNFLLNR